MGAAGTPRAGPALQPTPRAVTEPGEETDVGALTAEIQEEIKLHPTLTLRETFSLSTTTA